MYYSGTKAKLFVKVEAYSILAPDILDFGAGPSILYDAFVLWRRRGTAHAFGSEQFVDIP
jgi:hypothetical protein